jgi:hypothetical protein
VAKKKVIDVQIDNGVIITGFHGHAKSIKDFFHQQETQYSSKFRVAGWDFNQVYLTHGNQENGAGWAFY